MELHLPKKITLKNKSFFHLMSMVQASAEYGYKIVDWDIKYHTFLGFITQIDYTIIMEIEKGDRRNDEDGPLDVKLEKALASEDYEQAAKIRDQIRTAK